MNFRMKISALLIPILAIAFASCSKEELNDKTNEVNLKSESGPEQYVVEESWRLDCEGKRGSTVTVDVTEHDAFPIAGSDYTLYFRPAGSTGPFTLFASNTSSSFPLFFEWTGQMLAPGCYEFTVAATNQGHFLPAPLVSPNMTFTTCCM